jgi:catechol 2,3-dioxygenase-like lactoylglutathione lyase family enzyme
MVPIEQPLSISATNTILYCRNWQETVAFYRDALQFPITFASNWFVEFQIASTAHLSIADERRATIKSSRGEGITLTFRVDRADEAWGYLSARGLALGPLQDHTWGARVFYFYDPEGHRLEMWSPI